MVGDPYEAADDPACYPDTRVLRNLADLAEGSELEAFEVEAVGRRSLEPPPSGEFDPTHYRALHRHLFQDVYAWAGQYRAIRTAKGGNWFCFPEYIASQMEATFTRLDEPPFLPEADCETFIAQAAAFLADLNAVHPFREGNGRTQLAFLRLLGQRAGCPLRLEAIEPEPLLAAMIESFSGSFDGLVDELERLLV